MATTPAIEPSDVFWAEIPPCEHLLQLYDSDDDFLDSLEGFIAGGLMSGEGVIVIATPQHLALLHKRLWARGIDWTTAKSTDQYIPLEARATLSKFMSSRWPDEELFAELVKGLLARARGEGRKVRAFGEMVAVMWARGEHQATVRLEQLWKELCASEGFSLFCAYPNAGFAKNATQSIKEICAAHTQRVEKRSASISVA